MSEKGFVDLKRDIIENELCTRCGACVASCPVDALTYGPDSIELTGKCIDCGICIKVCPGGGVDLSKHEKNLFGRSRKTPSGHRLGVYKEKVHMTSRKKEILRVGYYGGRITSVLVAGLESGLIEAALLTDWNGEGHLSIGDAKIARTKEDILSLASSKYVFSPVLTKLKEIADDPKIKNAAIVGLPCAVQGFRKMCEIPETVKLTKKVKYVIGLPCGAPQTDEETWKKRINTLTGTDPQEIGSFSYRKISSSVIRLEVVKKNGDMDTREMKMPRFLHRVAVGKKWSRCSMCPDYSNELSDITFGAPIVRTEKGQELLENAIEKEYLKRSSFKKSCSQDITDLAVFHRKKQLTKKMIRKRKKAGLPFPEYR